MDKKNKILISVFGFVVFSVIIGTITLIVSGIKSFISKEPVYDYALFGVFDNDYIPVNKTENDQIVRPYVSDKVKVGKSFYDFESSSEKQENSLIVYENTYIQNNGVDYISDDEFEVSSVLDGEIISIEENEYYGTTITVKHNDNLSSVYSNVNNVLPSVGYRVSKGEIIATSSINKKVSTSQLLHFEVYYKGNAIDPEGMYTLKVSDLK